MKKQNRTNKPHFYNIVECYKWFLHPRHKGYTVIFHNGGNFDYNFIAQQCFLNGMDSKDLTMTFNANSIKYMEISSVKMRFIDSVLFFQQPLKNLPGMFNLNNLYEITSKGYFRHRFNNADNYDYIVPMPDIKFYEVDRMKVNVNCKSK